MCEAGLSEVGLVYSVSCAFGRSLLRSGRPSRCPPTPSARGLLADSRCVVTSQQSGAGLDELHGKSLSGPEPVGGDAVNGRSRVGEDSVALATPLSSKAWRARQSPYCLAQLVGCVEPRNRPLRAQNRIWTLALALSRWSAQLIADWISSVVLLTASS